MLFGEPPQPALGFGQAPCSVLGSLKVHFTSRQLASRQLASRQQPMLIRLAGAACAAAAAGGHFKATCTAAAAKPAGAASAAEVQALLQQQLQVAEHLLSEQQGWVQQLEPDAIADRSVNAEQRCTVSSPWLRRAKERSPLRVCSNPARPAHAGHHA